MRGYRQRQRDSRARSYTPLIITAVLAIGVAVVVFRLTQRGVSIDEARRAAAVRCTQVAAAFIAHQSNGWLTVSARVVRLLPDSYGRFQHQRFILACPSGETVLIENDVSVGQRVPVYVGATVAVHGEFIWNAQGGLIHDTHGGSGQGWILFQGKVYDP